MFLFLTLVTLAAEPAAETLSPAEAARLEAKHLTNIRQVTSGFAKAGEGYFRPDGRAIIFQARRPPPAGGRLPDLHARPRPGRPAADGQHRQGQVHLQLLPS